jgi:hypothetical protein
MKTRGDEEVAMFVQVIQGPVADAEGLRAAVERWQRDLAPGAVGWLGSTSGVTDDGRFIALVRFESTEAARRNSDRPEQDAWWQETSKLFEGDATFYDCEDVVVAGRGGSDDAGFVQVIQGRVRDPEQARALGEQSDDVMQAHRPDIIGSIVANHGDGGFTTAVYFTSEAEAREGERKELPPEAQEDQRKMMELMEGELTYYDLRQPLLRSPA